MTQESVSARPFFYHAPKVAKSCTRLSRFHGIALGEPGRVKEPGGNLRDAPHGDAHSCIGEVAVQFGRNVEVDKITLVELAC
jgi:hypothetical protein